MTDIECQACGWTREATVRDGHPTMASCEECGSYDLSYVEEDND